MDKFAPTYGGKQPGSPMTYREAEAIARICIAQTAAMFTSFSHPSIKSTEELGKVMQAARHIEQQMVQMARSQYHSENGKELPNAIGNTEAL